MLSTLMDMLTLSLIGVTASMGAFALLRGKISLSTNRVVQGTPAGFIGITLLLALPLSSGTPILDGILHGIRLRESPSEDWLPWLTFVATLCPFVVCAAVALIVAVMTGESPVKKAPDSQDVHAFRQPPEKAVRATPQCRQ